MDLRWSHYDVPVKRSWGKVVAVSEPHAGVGSDEQAVQSEFPEQNNNNKIGNNVGDQEKQW